jgi:hypothetical protein
VVGRRIYIRIVFVIAPHPFAFAFAKLCQLGYGWFLPADTVDVPNRVKGYTALRTVGEGVRRRGPQGQELEKFRWDIRIEMQVFTDCWKWVRVRRMGERVTVGR